MGEIRKMSDESFEIYPIGYVRRRDDGGFLEILEPYRPAMNKLEEFSHVIVLWWADKHDNPEHRAITETDLPYAEGVRAGLFACRSEYRPNPISLTTCRLEEVDHLKGKIRVNNIDAFDGTPILDLKAYFPVLDRVREPKTAWWTEGWPEWLPDEGIGLE
jgi:tRNA-Thr(GGU) m(6)t(6)A37 methyltransferase TsaA